MTRQIWVADSETDPFKKNRIPKPFIWGAYNGCEYHEFKTPDQFVNFISEIDCIVYAHNGGKFDWHYILHRLSAFDEITVIAGRVARFKIGKAEFRDSYSIIPIPLAQYKKDDIDYSIMESGQREKPENARKISDYLRADCVYLFELVTSFINNYGVKLTLAGAALNQWQIISGNKPPESTQSFYNSLAPYYYGGRVECIESGIIKAGMVLVDINSAYPEAMLLDHPYGTAYYITDALPPTRQETERAFITLECISDGALPYREKTGLSFPRDDIPRVYHITGWEFLAAVDTKALRKVNVIEVLQFPDKINFADYVFHFYEMKENSAKGSPDYIFAKLMLNSLYGKFAANPENYSEYKVVPPRYIDAAGSEGFDYCCDLAQFALMQRDLPEEKHRFYNVAVSASITGYVRAKLWRALCAVERPIYCDTDSILCANTGALKLHPTDLGSWDIEAEIDSAAIAGKKLYSLRKSESFYADEVKRWKEKGSDENAKPKLYKTASKGVRLTPNELYAVAMGEMVNYAPESPTYSLTRGIGFNSRNIIKRIDTTITS